MQTETQSKIINNLIKLFDYVTLICCFLGDLMNRYMFLGLLLISGSLGFWAYADKSEISEYNKQPKITQKEREELFKTKVYEETKKNTDETITTNVDTLKEKTEENNKKAEETRKKAEEITKKLEETEKEIANIKKVNEETKLTQENKIEKITKTEDIEIDPNISDSEYFDKAIKFNNENNVSDALINIEKAIKVKKTQKYLQYKAFFLQKSEKYNEVINFIYETIDSGEFEDDYYAYYLLGEAQFALKKYTQSKESYKKSIELNNQYQSTYLGLGKSLYHLDSKKKAIEYLLIAKKKNIKGSDVDEYLCKSYKDLNDETNAAKYCK